MKVSELKTKLTDIVVEQLGVSAEQVTPEASFIDDLAAALDAVELLMAVEEEFGIEIPDEEAEKWTTFAKALEGLTKMVGAEAD